MSDTTDKHIRLPARVWARIVAIKARLQVATGKAVTQGDVIERGLDALEEHEARKEPSKRKEAQGEGGEG